MNRDDVIRMAREAGLLTIGTADGSVAVYTWPKGITEELERFAALAYAAGADAEREACAKVCDEKVDAEYATGKVDHNEMGWTQACAIAIRARGQA